MKNILVAQIHGLGTFARGVMLETLQILIDENPGANIYYLTCSNTFNVCYINTSRQPEICYLCKRGVKKGMDLIDGNFIHVVLEDIISEEDKISGADFRKENFPITKDVYFKGYEVGEAAISSYISKTRDKSLLNIKNSFTYDLVENDVVLYNALERFFREKSIDLVYNFNGRNSYQRAVLNISEKYKIDCINKEIARPGGIVETFKNALPHNIQTKMALIEEAWENSKLDLSERIKLGSSFYEKKLKGEQLNDTVYTKDQVANKLPENVDYSKKTFVLFTSSDDEFAAVGKDFINPFFKDQNEGIAFVANLFATKFKDYNLLIRMHPNLKGIEYDYATDLRKMDTISENVTVIVPESSVDSYALLKVAEKVIVFGSTIGMEANYWEKPVILLGKSFYFYMDVAYVPKDKNEIEELLKIQLKPKEKIDAIKFGYYFLEGGVKAKYYHNDSKKRVFYKGKQLYKISTFERSKAAAIRLANRFLGARLFVN